ncbi:MAG: hypothetical protein H6867_11230 [Rhodospirillales bacterium]|nr:hypothetical protein [Rhodospirillales bacterium]MCB9996702.1 hypothetical protein [Rhodospirillales bacterium]
MRLFRVSTLLSVGGAVAAGALLFWTSQHVQQAEDRLAGMTQAVQSEQQSIRVLDAEWDYLNRPDRLEALAAEYLGLSSAAAFSVGENVSDLPQVTLPVMPPRKPLLAAQPASLEITPEAPRLPQPKAPVPPAQDHMQFQSLLESLSDAEGTDE